MSNVQLVLLTTLVAMKFLCGMVSASDEDYLKDYENDMRPTLNNKGDHLPNLGPTQEEFYKYCEALDLNMHIHKPVVAIFGGAYGKRAVAVLQQTSRVTVVLNDLDERHFEEIKEWSKHKNYDKRLKLAPGSFLDTHKCQCVQDIFKNSPIKFNAILIANVFHHLHPIDGMKGLRYIADHLVDGGEAFLMTAQLFKGIEGETQDQRVAKDLLTLNKGIHDHGVEWVNKSIELSGISFENTFTIYVQNRQRKLLYDFNKTHGITFPGYISAEVDTLNPLYLKLSDFAFGAPNRISFFLSTPEEMKYWCNTVGLTFQEAHYLNVHQNQVFIFNRDEARYYFARLKRALLPMEAEYRILLQKAECVDQELKNLHAGKYFEIGDEFPYFRITNMQEENNLFIKLFNRDETVIVPLGRLRLKQKDYEGARVLFQYAADIGIEEGQEEINQL